MKSARQIREHYFFTDEDAKNLLRLKPIMEAIKDKAADGFYRFVGAFEETARLMPEEKILAKHRLTIQQWFMNLFEGRYDDSYFNNLQHTGRTHVQIGLDGHYVNAAMTVFREAAEATVLERIADDGERQTLLASLEKILDMNLDVMTSSYREAELRKVFLSYKLDNFLIRFAERFTYGLNLILVISLMGISLLVVGLFAFDLRDIFAGKAEQGILGALGTLLIIWVMIELMGNEIRQLKGGRFRIQVFLGVALVAFIREVLIASLAHHSTGTQLFLVGAILAIGIVYWLIAKAEHPRTGD